MDNNEEFIKQIKEKEKKAKKKYNYISIVLVFVLAIIGFVLGFIRGYNEKIADYIIYGKIYTGVNGKIADAVAIKDGKYIFVGDKEDVTKYIGKDTEELTYNDGLVLSGFTDTHTHVTNSFAASEYQMDLTNAKTVDEYKTIIGDYYDKHPDEEMYIGRGWNYMLFENGAPSKTIIDEIISDKPVFIKSGDGHSAWVNSKFIELIGVTKDTENPIGGEIVRDENGDAQGCFKDSAMDVFVKPNIIPYSVEQYKHLIELDQEYYSSLGYNSYIEIFVDSDSANYNLFKAYEEMDKEGKLYLRVQAGWNVANSDDVEQKIKKLADYKEEAKGGMFELTDIKIFMDGVAETHTAYFSEPYADEPDNYGADRWPLESGYNNLVKCVETANKYGFVAHFHAMGDEAITKALNAVQEVRNKHVNDDIRNVITHFESAKESDLKRLKDLNVIIAANLAWGSMDDVLYPTVEVKNLGEQRAFKAYPYKSALDYGAVISSATDYSASPAVSPILAYIIAVNRNYTSDDSLTRDSSQKMSVDEALRTLSYGGAYQMGQEAIRGTIEVGKSVDLIVLDTDITSKTDISAYYSKIIFSMVNDNIIINN